MSWEPIDNSNPNGEEVIGDDPFDTMAEALEQISAQYQADLKRLPTVNELVTTFKQALETRLGEISKEGLNNEIQYLKIKLKRIPTRQKFAVGDVLRAKLENGEHVYGRVFEIHESMGPFIGVYDSKGMDSQYLDKIISKRLIVKVTPIHPEILQDKKEWLVIGNRMLTAEDTKKPRGPKSISGVNEQLLAANYVYGNTTEKRNDIEDWIINGSQ